MALAREQRQTRALKDEGPTRWSGLRVTREQLQITRERLAGSSYSASC